MSCWIADGTVKKEHFYTHEFQVKNVPMEGRTTYRWFYVNLWYAIQRRRVGMAAVHGARMT